MSSILSHGRMKNPIFWERFQLFRHQTESNMCSYSLQPPRLPPSKAPLTIGRSWVQFLVMTEWKTSFSQKISPFPTLDRDVISFIQVRAVIRYIGIGHFRSPPCPLGGKEGNSPTSSGQNTDISRKVSIFSTSVQEQYVFIYSFSFYITPFESTFVNWEVVSSILSHDRMKKSHFLRKFHLFRL